MLEFLLKYPADTLRAGELEISVPWGTFLVLLAAAAVIPYLLGYTGLPESARPAGWRDRAGLVSLRAGLFAVVLFALTRPTLVVPVDVPARGRVAVLVDDSLSMLIADQSGATRAAYALDAFAPARGELSRALESRFDTTYFRFSSTAARFRSASELSFSGVETDLAAALEQSRGAFTGRPPDAFVVVTDGGGAADASSRALDALRAESVPVHIVGVGSERFARDLEISSVRIPASALAGDTIEVEIKVTHRGFDEQPVRLVVENESLIVAERALVMPRGRGGVTTRLSLPMREPGLHELVFRLPRQRGETVEDNNEDRAVVNVRDGRIDILHVEGEPRFEVKFVRRAVSNDRHIRMLSLVHTSDNKLYRLGVEAPQELADGFPTTAGALFPFHVVVLGSVEAARFSPEQQRLLVDFVGRRGGGVLLLGGRRAFAEGRYGDSALAAIMPVALDARAQAFDTRVSVSPARPDSRHAILRSLGGDVWSRLPPLNVVNPVRRLKPGATLLLGGRDGDGPPLVVLATQRYGRGTVAALPVRDTWRWQMHSDIPAEDQSHETLWRELLRWLARTALGRVRVDLPQRSVAAGQPVRLAADVVDEAYEPLGGAAVRLTVESPLGERARHDLEWLTGFEGRYGASFVPTESGRYDLRVALLEGERVVAEETASVYATGSGREFYDAELDAPALRRLAQETGGRYYDAADAVALPGAIAPAAGGRRVIQRLPLWDAPALYLLIVALAGAEWFLRRRRRLR